MRGCRSLQSFRAGGGLTDAVWRRILGPCVQSPGYLHIYSPTTPATTTTGRDTRSPTHPGQRPPSPGSSLVTGHHLLLLLLLLLCECCGVRWWPRWPGIGYRAGRAWHGATRPMASTAQAQAMTRHNRHSTTAQQQLIQIYSNWPCDSCRLLYFHTTQKYLSSSIYRNADNEAIEIAR